ncbi:MAG: GDSL-type esterase/lipase family protein [Oscillospiraceae bacterium]
MNKVLSLTLALVLLLSACGPAVETVAPTPSPTPTVAPTPTPTPTPPPTPTPYPYGTVVAESAAVADDYFADVAFIGDSRTEGLKLYAGIEGATFLSATSMTVFNIGKKTVKYDGGNKLVMDALKDKDYGKIYFCLGLNELGWKNDEAFHTQYAAVVDEIMAAEPDALIYLQLLIPVNTQKRIEKKGADYVNNEQIAVYNGIITQIAAEKKVLLVDPGTAMVDDTGEPPYDSTGDGIHFNKAGYALWRDYLKTHTLTKEALS